MEKNVKGAMETRLEYFDYFMILNKARTNIKVSISLAQGRVW